MKRLGTYQKGLWSEGLAMAALMLKGYRILNWRYKTKVGEIDVIAARGKVLAFVEVKQRGTPEDALYSLTPQMRRRITQAARHYQATHPRCAALIQRFDLIAVSGFSVRHLDNAWMDTP